MTDLSDRDVEALLRKYRPLDQPVEGWVQPRVWPWAAAAAALLAISIGMHVSTPGQTNQRPNALPMENGSGNELSISNPTVAAWLEHTRTVEQRRNESARARIEADSWR